MKEKCDNLLDNDRHRSPIQTPGSILLCYIGHALMENRMVFVVDTRVTLASGTAERDAAVDMVETSQAVIASPLEQTRDTTVLISYNNAVAAVRQPMWRKRKKEAASMDGLHGTSGTRSA